MSYPIRYSAAGTKIVETDPAGPLVEYADYAILEAENARLKAEVERLDNLVRYWSDKYKIENARFLRACERIASNDGKPTK